MNEIKHKNKDRQDRMLYPEVEKLLTSSNENRIKYIKEGRFIEYDVARILWQEILDLFEQPIRPRMEGLLIISPTNNGKTSLITKFINKYSPSIGNLVYVETPERTTLKEFYVEILNVLGYPAKGARTSTGDLRRKILIAVEKQKVKMFFFDEIHNLLDSRRDHKRDILNGLKSLSNKSQIPIILVGIEIAEEILDLDKQVADRYPAIEMPLWEYGTDGYYDLLATFEAFLPLKKPSHLDSPKISKKIYDLSKGKLGRISTIIRRSAIQAIRSESERITWKILNSIPFRW